jgi:hypothetical protein
MKKIVSFLSLLLCCSLVACDHYTATSDVTYVMEEESSVYPNNHYLPLLDIINRFEDFHEEDLATKENPYIGIEGEEEAAANWEAVVTIHVQAMDISINELKIDIVDLLRNTVTIEEYLYKLIYIQDRILSIRIKHIVKLLNNEPGALYILPSSKKLFDFLMEDNAVFKQHKANNKRVYFTNLVHFELITNLMQAAIHLTDREEINAALLNRIQSLAGFAHPDAMGGPYSLLEDLIFGNNLPRKKVKHRKELNRLLQFYQFKKQYPSFPLGLARLLFQGIYTHTNPLITYHFLQLIEDKNIKIWWGKAEKPSNLEYQQDLGRNLRIGSSIQPALEKYGQLPETPSQQKSYRSYKQERRQASWTSDDWLAYIEGTATKKKSPSHLAKYTTNRNKPQRSSLTTSPSYPSREKKTSYRPLKQSLQHTKALSSIHRPSLEDNAMPIAASPLNEKPTPVIPLQPISTNTKLSLLPIIEEAAATDHPTVLPVTISPTSTTQAASNNASLMLPLIEKESTIDYLAPTIEDSVLLPTKQPLSLSSASIPSKTAKKQAPIKIIIVKKTTTQAATPAKEKVQQEAEAMGQQKEPNKETVPVAPLENCSPAPQPAPPQNTIQAIPQHLFTMPQGLRSFHAQQLQAAHPIIHNPKHLPTINQLFDPATQCNVTYKVFATLWAANGGDIKQKGGSHCTLQFPQGTNLFGIYKPHGSSATYGKQAIRYLQAAALYIGLRPTNWY